MGRAKHVDLDRAMRAHVAATIAVARTCIAAASEHRPLTMPELRKAEAHFLDFAVSNVRADWTKQGLPQGTLDLFAGPLEAHYRVLFAERFYDAATLATMAVGVGA